MASNLHTFTGNEVIATEVPSYLNQNFTNLNTDKADKSTTYTKSEVDSLVANSGRDCLKTTGGVLNGTTVITEATDTTEAVVGTVFETSDSTSSIVLSTGTEQGMDGGIEDGLPDDATICSRVALFGDGDNKQVSIESDRININALKNIEMQSLTDIEMSVLDVDKAATGTLASGMFAVSPTGGVISSYEIAEDFSSFIMNTVEVGEDGIDLGIHYAKDGVTSDNTLSIGTQATPLWNKSPMPLQVNGITPDSNGNIEIPAVSDSKCYAPLNYYVVDGDKAVVTNMEYSGVPFGSAIRIYDGTSNSRPRYFRVAVAYDTIESLPFDRSVAAMCGSQSAMQDLMNSLDTGAIRGSDASSNETWFTRIGTASHKLVTELLPCPESTDGNPVWIAFSTMNSSMTALTTEQLSKIKILCFAD